MRSNKPYTNATFTKRVDHEAGRHRAGRAPAEPRVCGSCGSVYERRRWRAAEDSGSNRAPGRPTAAALTTCPACRRQRDGVPGGFVYLEGAFFKAHGDEIERLLRNEARRARHDNPLARVIDSERAGGRLTVTTTTEHLAQRLGHALEKAYGGRVRYDFSHENKLARVWWRRD